MHLYSGEQRVGFASNVSMRKIWFGRFGLDQRASSIQIGLAHNTLSGLRLWYALFLSPTVHVKPNFIHRVQEIPPELSPPEINHR